MTMTNLDKLNSSMNDLVSTLYDLTGQIVEEKNYDKIDIGISTVDKLTTNIKRLTDIGISIDIESIKNEKEVVNSERK